MTTRTDLDLLAARPTRETVDLEFTPDRRAALLQAVLDTPPAGTSRAPRTRRTLLLAAAGVVVALAAGGALGDLPARVPGGRLLPISAQPAAADTLERLATRAGEQPGPAALSAGQYRRVVTVDQQSGDAPITHEAYVDSDGWTWREDTENLDHTWFLYQADAGLHPASLPTDPAALEQVLRRQSLGTASEDQGLFKLIGELALTESAPAPVRAASLEILTGMAARPAGTIPGRKEGTTEPRVTVSRGALGGRPVTGAHFTDTTRPGLLLSYWFDSDTSQLVRTDQTFPGGGTFSSEVRSRGVVDQLPDGISRKLGTERVEKIVK